MDRTLSHLVQVAGLVVGAGGIAILWAAGVEFPFAIPPGIVILLIGALFVGLAGPWWVPIVGVLLGLFVFVAGMISPTGISNLVGEAGPAVALGQAVQIAGVVTASVAGVFSLQSRRALRSSSGAA